jgi:hypothetical protein
MNQSNQSSDNSFVELGSAPLPTQTVPRSNSNIVKNIQVKSIQFGSFSSHSNKDCDPIVNINKSGDTIESIEFVCSCGKTKVLTFDYDEE